MNHNQTAEDAAKEYAEIQDKAVHRIINTENLYPYFKGEMDGQIIRLKSLGLHQQDGTFEQLINAVIYMAAEQKNEITALKSAGKELFSIYMDMDENGVPKVSIERLAIAWGTMMNLINDNL